MGKKYIISILGIVGLCLCFTSCTKSKEYNEEVFTKDSKEITNISTELNKANEKISITIKDGLKDETLVNDGDDEDSYGHEILEVNIKEESYQVLVCKDTVNDIVYYVNYGVDYFIYRIKDGKSELVIEMPAKRLFYLDGKLYFILESYDTYNLTEIKDGNIFCYDPVSGEVSMISDAVAETMFVYSDGIYYNVETYVDLNDETLGKHKMIYYYSFATSKSEEINTDFITSYKWKDYFISYEMEEVEEGDELYEIYGNDDKISKTVSLKLETLDQTETIELTDNAQIRNYSIVGNKFYYILEGKKIVIFDIETKETKEIPLAMECHGDFTMLNGMIYLVSLSQINPETGMQSVITPEKSGEEVYELYTDGENLYGLCGTSGGGGYGVMKRIELEETPDNAIILEKEDGKSFEMNRYIFRTLPMREEY